MKLRIFKILKKTKVEGPGTRFCIWVQGCSKHCEGCYAKESWDKKGGYLVDIDELFEEIKNSKEIEGVTFLGGEPFEQAKELSFLAKKIKEIGLSILTFSGNTYDELLKKNDIHTNKLLKYTDLLIDGGFEKDKFDLSRAWVGSKNQRYIFLTDRYSEKDILNIKNKVEMRILKNGEIFMNGMGDFDKLLKQLRLRKK